MLTKVGTVRGRRAAESTWVQDTERRLDVHALAGGWPNVMAVISAPVPFGPAWDSRAGSGLEKVRSELEQPTAEFCTAEGTYTFPMACRLYWHAIRLRLTRRRAT